MKSYSIDSKNFLTRLVLPVAALAMLAHDGDGGSGNGTSATPAPPPVHAVTDYEVTLHLQRLGLERS